MSLTVHARNHFVFLDTVMVISTARYVAYLRSFILDPGPGGNNDSILNPGETVKIPAWVKNWGQQTANGVTGRLRTHDPNAQITDSVKTFGTIAAGDSAWTGENGFGLHVNSGLANGYAVACSLICKDALDSVWVSHVTFYVGTPVLVKGTVTVRDSAHGGNNNGRIDPGEISDLEIHLRNTGLGHGYNCHAVLRSSDSRFQILDSTASYGTIRKGDSATNPSDRFTVHANSNIPPETPISCTLHMFADGGFSSTAQFTIVVGEIRQTDPIPDGPRTPALYWAYEDVDSFYEERPVFNWVEINNRGTRLTLNDDQTVQISLPPAFGPFIFYGQSYTQLSICSNGFVAPGYTTFSSWTEQALPKGSEPPMLAVNWDDIYPPIGNGVWYYHDTANHRFVIEWDSVAYYSQHNILDKYEIILYDTTLAASDGNCEFAYQYLRIDQNNSCTVGSQDHTYAIGINALYDGNYHRGSAPLVAGRAIKFTTDPPVGIGEAEDWRSLSLNRVPLLAYPNPFGGQGIIAWNVKTEGRVSLRVFDVTGREVRKLVDSRMKPGSYSVVWDGRASTGRQVAAGVYFYRLETASGTWEQKVTLTR